MIRSSETFLQKLSTATDKKDCGLYVYDGYLSPRNANDAFAVLGNDALFPWDNKPVLGGERLTQHAYGHDRYKYLKGQKNKSFRGLSKLEEICSNIEDDFGIEISYVFCNRFQDPNHFLDWHKDTYGENICVLTLGAPRRIEFRNNKTRAIEGLVPKSGDLYIMPLHINKTHKHKVWSAIETDSEASKRTDNTRLSFVFFFKAPKDVKEFKISRMDKAVGYLNYMLE
uniref:Fe2OG dioxygenase domain-containing protein n=1 Tax=Trieres chinensis TaxID=1514140 RepID=A0A7S2EJM4_TRICV|mmetsp:Transcript_26783/g.54820  ORF Transcript_26783/g.54820 Transcript_26783/m.54820 type:complete len:227 (-) Transcript_26783:55-735(-)|eukprot:CAMPEP_0183293780 /NCGR_PEP_ID=MMETSP0160_2-20130417/2343_1 /TAXON_ID=2839 ORGANISM="Odontella Sinensis, Strain Grunow 1884" /NCGR_SAMPLE_ID=MMETSP0160_2 /ASSEMBLY_ACC=CAM_ASM_000250 /LENGTH=226 /DNA_ID=CAMNT_0025454959 /DNA_START=54 /DNA_END=734 /DNA_ORIENTATION=+